MNEKTRLFIVDYKDASGQYCHQEHLIIGFQPVRDFDVVNALLSEYQANDCKLIQVSELLNGYNYKDIEKMYADGKRQDITKHMRPVFADSVELKKATAC